MTKEVLTPAEKLAIRDEVSRFLGKTAAVIGIGTIVAVLGGLAAIYNDFGERAVKEAGQRTDKYLADRSANIDERIEQALDKSEALQEKMSELSGKTEFLNDDMEAARAEAERIKAELSKLRQDDVVSDLSEFVQVVGDNPDVANIYTRLDRLDSLDRGVVETGVLVPTENELLEFRDKSSSIEDDGKTCKEGPDAHRGTLNRAIRFKKKFSQPPTVTLSIRNLDAYTGESNFRLSLLASDVTTTGFNASLYTFCDTRIWRADATWIAVGR